jgi:chromosome segregation ATPase
MSSPEPEPSKPRNWWIWISAALAVVAVGLLAWALSVRSDLDSTEQDLAAAKKELTATKEELDTAQQELASANEELQSANDDHRAEAVVAAGSLAAAKALYDDLAEQLGATEEDLDATQQDVADAQERADQAEQDAADAAEQASQAGNETEKAQAEAEQARAEAEAANAQLEIAVDCAKAYVTAFGELFEGDDPEDQAAAVRKQFESITKDCKDALAA